MRSIPARFPVLVGVAATAAVVASMLATPAGAAPSRLITEQQLDAMPADYTPDLLYAVEAQLLGKEHAREHQAERNQARLLASEGKIVVEAPHAQVAGVPDQIGSWTAPFIPTGIGSNAIGVHAILFNTGKVLLFGGYLDSSDNTLETDAYLFDPTTGTAKEVDPPHNTFCAGEVLLQDGTLLVVGGRLANTHPTPGTPYVLLFDPVSEQWLPEPDTVLGRYYPTTTELPDGRVLVTTGNMTTGKLNRTVEVFTPGVGGAQGSFQTVLDNVTLDLYPKQYVMPDGSVLVIQHNLTSLLNTTTWAWTKLPNLTVARKNNPSSILLPAGPGQPQDKVLMAGGAQTQRGATTATTELFDDTDPTAGWTPMTSMPDPRTHMNVVYLPDGKVLGVGGNSFDRFGQPQYAALMYDPVKDTWTEMASQALRRAYHSTALLLPDGRVLSAGDTGPGGGGVRLEIYSPPYLFGGPRPAITSLSAKQLSYGASVKVRTDVQVSHYVLIHPTAVTHANDMSGRFVELAVSSRSGTASWLKAPANANLAQPGYYMLFAVDANGVPSVATWVHLGPMTYGG